MLGHGRHLVVDLGLGGLGEGQLDLDGIVAGELHLGAQVDGEGEHVGLAGLHKLGLVHGGAGHGAEALGVDGGGPGAVQHLVGDAGAHGLGAERVVDNRARGLAAAEAREIVLASEVLVGLIDAPVDIDGINGHGDFGLVALKGLNVCFHE